MGIPQYGRGFTLDNPNQNGIKAPAKLPIPEGPYAKLEGAWGYNEVQFLVIALICLDHLTILLLLSQIVTAQLEGGWTIVRDPCYQAPYMYKNNLWIGYDDEQSVILKVLYSLIDIL